MAYIGNPIYQSAFVTDTFSGNGTTTAFTMSVAPAGTTNVLVAISGVLQDPSTYGVVGTTITFSSAPPSGTGNISCRYLGIPVTGVTTTAYRTVTEFTATAGQTTFTPPSYTVGFINVYRNGVLLGSADYTATNGTTVVLTTGATSGDLVTVESFLVSSVLNALPQSGGTISGNLVVTGKETVPTITSPSATALTIQSANTTAITIDTSQNVGIGTTSIGSFAGYTTEAIGGGSSAGGIIQFQGASNADGAHVRLSRSGSTITDFTIETRSGTSAPLLFGTNGTERMRINSSGYITAPYQVSFNAYTTASVTSLGVVTLNNVNYNIGSAFNTSTNRFTAPVAGRYLITAGIAFSNVQYFDVYLRKNAGAFNNGDFGQNGGGVGYPGNTIAQVVQLNANDYIDMYLSSLSGATSSRITFTFMTGELLG